MKTKIRKWLSMMMGCILLVPTGTILADGGGAKGEVDTKILFDASQSNEYGLYRIPGIVTLDDGAMIAYTEARKNSSDWADMDIVMRKSTDQGQTWSGDMVLVDGTGDNDALISSYPPGTMNNPVMIPDGEKVHILYCVEYHEVYYTYSEDAGSTWQEPVNITESCRENNPYPFKVIATGPGHGIVLSENSANPGRLTVPIWMANGSTNTAHSPSVVSTLYSDDQGATWHVGEVVYATSDMPNPNETTMVELSDGRVMLNMRNTSGRKRRAITISDDGASNWSTPRFDEALIDPICFGSTIKYDENTILFTNAKSTSSRVNITVKLSEDDAKTWPYEKTIEIGPGAYSDITVDRNKNIQVLYEVGGNLKLATLRVEDIKQEEPGKLKSLQLSEGDISFYKDIYSYAVTLEDEIKTIELTPIAYEGTENISINGKNVSNGETITVDVTNPRVNVEIITTSGEQINTYSIQLKKQIKTDENSLVAHWKMEGLDEGMIVDSTNHYNELKVVMGTELPKVVEGRRGNAVEFGNSYFEINDATGLDVGTGDFTVSAWIKPKITTGQQFLFWYGSASSKQWWTRINSGKLQFLIGREGKEQLVETPIRADEWTHISCQKAQGTIKIYINGVEVGKTILEGTFDVNGTNRLRVGREISGAVRQYSGAMDDVRFYNYALDEEAIMKLVEGKEDEGIETVDYAMSIQGIDKVDSGESFEMLLEIESTKLPIYAQDVVIGYDPELLQWIGSEKHGEIIIVEEVKTEGHSRIILAMPQGITDKNTIMTLEFKAKDINQDELTEIAVLQANWGIINNGESKVVNPKLDKQSISIVIKQEELEGKEDVNKDGIVDIADLALVAYYYQVHEGSSEWETAKIADVNRDKVIDILDLGIVANKVLEK